jgi:hypothetical protein
MFCGGFSAIRCLYGCESSVQAGYAHGIACLGHLFQTGAIANLGYW